MNFHSVAGRKKREKKKIIGLIGEATAKGAEMQSIVDCAKEHSVYVSVGYSERDAVTATLYNSNIMIAPDGQTMNHRKLKPTGSERVIWGDADKDFFPVMETPWGPMGNLICWESYMPLARVALYQKGVALYISPNTNDNEEWQNTIRHIAIEGHCFFINADMYFTKDMYPKTASGDEEIAKLNDIVCRGGSCVIDPYGHAVSETVWDKEDPYRNPRDHCCLQCVFPGNDHSADSLVCCFPNNRQHSFDSFDLTVQSQFSQKQRIPYRLLREKLHIF